MSDRLAGRTALVTGAASGIGRGIARRFVAEGATVAALDIDGAGLEALAVELGEDVQPIVCDVTDEAAIADATAAAARIGQRDRLDVVVANAGKGTFSPIVDHPLETWREILDLCLTGVFLTIKHAAPKMDAGGSIVTIASINAVQPSAGMSAYCAAKAGVVELTRVASMELGSDGIRVNAIAPGIIETAATGTFWSMPGVVEEFVDNTNVGRYGTPDDVAAVAAFLASDDASFVTGSTYTVDGGATTKRYPDIPAAIERLNAL